MRRRRTFDVIPNFGLPTKEKVGYDHDLKDFIEIIPKVATWLHSLDIYFLFSYLIKRDILYKS